MSRPLLVSALAVSLLGPGAALSGDVIVDCMSSADDCRTRVIRVPDGLPGQVLKFEYCREGDCDRSHRERWITHFLVPPPGELCSNADIGEALHWLEQNRRGWLLAGWGCVSKVQLPT